MASTRLQQVLVLVGALVLAALLRCQGLANHGVWLDESYEIRVAQQASVKAMIATQRVSDISPPLHYLVLRGWAQVFGWGEGSLRGLSVTCSLLMITACYACLRSLYPTRPVAPLGALLLALAPLSVHYAREIRPYSLLSLLVVLSFTSLYEALYGGNRGGGEKRAWVAYSLLSTAMFFTHYGAFTVLAAFAVLVCLSERPAQQLLRFALATLPLLLLFALWYPVFADQNHTAGHTFGRVIWDTRGPLIFYDTLNAFCGARLPYYILGRPPMDDLPVLGLPALLLALGSALGQLRTLPVGDERTATRALLVCSLLPPLILLGITARVHYTYIPARTDFVFFAPTLMLMAYGLACLSDRVRLGAVSVLVLVCTLTLALYTNDTHRASIRQAVLADLASMRQPGDVVLCTTWANDTARYYVSQLDAPPPLVGYPAHYIDDAFRNPDLSKAYFGEQLTPTLDELHARLREAGNQGGVLLLAQTGSSDLQALIQRLYTEFEDDPQGSARLVPLCNSDLKFVLGRLRRRLSAPSK